VKLPAGFDTKAGTLVNVWVNKSNNDDVRAYAISKIQRQEASPKADKPKNGPVTTSNPSLDALTARVNTLTDQLSQLAEIVLAMTKRESE
jgi:hypothetical protein